MIINIHITFKYNLKRKKNAGLKNERLNHYTILHPNLGNSQAVWVSEPHWAAWDAAEVEVPSSWRGEGRRAQPSDKQKQTTHTNYTIICL